MRNETVTGATGRGTDWKAIGYLFSIAGVLFLGAQAWPKPTDPAWHVPALLAGIITSLIGFGVRYFAHVKEQREIEQTKREAERR